jgi:hypothetical protein
MRTIKDIKKGDLFCFLDHSEKFQNLYEVTEINQNKDGGKQVKDMWGGVVGEKPMFTIVGISPINSEKNGFSVQSENSNLDNWITFVDSKEDYYKKLYDYRKANVLKSVIRQMSAIAFPDANFPLSNHGLLVDDKEMQEFLFNLHATIQKAEKMLKEILSKKI